MPKVVLSDCAAASSVLLSSSKTGLLAGVLFSSTRGLACSFNA